MVSVAVWLASGQASAAGVAGVVFDNEARVGEQRLVLNGAGLRSKFLFKLYTVALYLPQKTADAGLAVAQAGPKRIRIVTLRDVGTDMFVEGLSKGIEKNHSASEYEAVKARLDQFAALLSTRKEVAKGSVVLLDLTPENQTRLGINGNTVGRDIAGEDFFRALLRVWLGNEPAQEDLKAALLGQ